MPGQYPNAIATFTTKVDSVDTVYAAHMNAVQSELVAIETELGTGLKGTSTTLAARLTGIQTNSDGYAANGVTTSGDQTINGLKTFTGGLLTFPAIGATAVVKLSYDPGGAQHSISAVPSVTLSYGSAGALVSYANYGFRAIDGPLRNAVTANSNNRYYTGQFSYTWDGTRGINSGTTTFPDALPRPTNSNINGPLMYGPNNTTEQGCLIFLQTQAINNDGVPDTTLWQPNGTTSTTSTITGFNWIGHSTTGSPTNGSISVINYLVIVSGSISGI